MYPRVEAFFHPASCTVSYVVVDESTGRCALVDSVLDYDMGWGQTGTVSADKIEAYVKKNGLTLDWILETHPHADHITAAQYLKRRLGGRIAIGANVAEVQAAFKRIYNLGSDFVVDGSQYDHLLADGERIPCGSGEITALYTPGHTQACMSYVVGDSVFVGDAIFMPDYGSGRTDFPGGDARTLYDSIKRLYELPGETRMFVCHDYAPNGRNYAWETTVAEQRAGNIHIRTDTDKEDFVALREERDAMLTCPQLMLVAIQINLRAGRFPPPEDNGVSYLKIPVNVF